MVFGYAVTLDVDHARIAWMDMDRTPDSRALRDAFRRLRPLRRGGPRRAASRDVQTLLDRGQVHAVVRVLPDFARDLARGRRTEVQVLLDGTNSNTASLVSSYASR